MRYLYAAITLLLGLVLLGLGIAQLTADGEETRSVETEGAQEAPFTVITDDIIDAESDRDEFTIEADGEYTLAVGRTFDIEAWIGDAAHNRVADYTEAEGDQPASIQAEYVDGESQAPNPEDSDLWAATESAEGDLLYRWSTPDDTGDWALLVFRDGEAPAPASISIEQTQQDSQALGIGLVIAGGLLTLLALALFYWASNSRKKTADNTADSDDDAAGDQPAMTETQEGQDAPSNQDQARDADQADNADQTGRSEYGRARRSIFSAVLATCLGAASAVGLAGPAHAEPTSSSEIGEATEDAQQSESEQAETEQSQTQQPEQQDPDEGYSVLLNAQLERILTDLSEVVETADAEQDAELLEERVAGDALQNREAAYRNYDLAEAELPGPIGTEVLSAAVTSSQDFPRQALVLTDHPDSEVPQILVLEQESARENYRLIHTTMMAPGTEFPSLSAEQGGTEQVDPSNEQGGTAPNQALTGLAEYYTDDEHDFGAELAESTYVNNLHQYYADLAEAAEDTDVSFSDPQVGEDITALSLPDGSTVVAGSFEMIMQMAPLQDGDTIFLDHELVVEMVGTDWTTFPTEISTTESVVLHLPAEDSDEDAVLLGVQDMIQDASIDEPEWFEGYDED